MEISTKSICSMAAVGLILFAASSAIAEGDAPLAGLWLGTAQIGEVSVLGDSEPRPAAGVFELPVLVHVDGNANARLLKEVVILPLDGGARLLADPLAQRALIAAQPDRVLKEARRVATPGMDLNGASMALAGTFAPGAALTVEIVLDPGLATNPFGHAFHPDHDNRDDQDPGRALRDDDREIYRIVRQIRIDIPEIPEGLSGEIDTLGGQTFARIVGLYSETVDGLASGSIHARGRLFLTRIDTSTELER